MRTANDIGVVLTIPLHTNSSLRLQDEINSVESRGFQLLSVVPFHPNPDFKGFLLVVRRIRKYDEIPEEKWIDGVCHMDHAVEDDTP